MSHETLGNAPKPVIITLLSMMNTKVTNIVGYHHHNCNDTPQLTFEFQVS